MNADLERNRLRDRWPAEFKDGVEIGLDNMPTGTRDAADYPAGFHGWPLDCRNAWFAGFNSGYSRRARG